MSFYDTMQDALEKTLISEFLGAFEGTRYQQFIGVVDYIRDEINFAFFHTPLIDVVWEHLRSPPATGEVELMILRMTQRFLFFLESHTPADMNAQDEWLTLLTRSLFEGGRIADVADANVDRLVAFSDVQKTLLNNPWFSFLIMCDYFHVDIKARLLMPQEEE